jgi:hypothetical protein
MKNLKLTALFMITVLLLSCEKEEVPVLEPINEEEVITTVRVTLTNGSNTIILESRDLDGDGPNAPVLTPYGNLSANTTYTGTVKFLNELENPIEDITVEVLQEGKEHQVFYQLTNSLGIVTYTDTDVDGKPIGLSFNLVTNNTGNGIMTVILRHVPNKNGAGVAAGNIANAGGETDAEISFPIVIQ